MLPIFMLLWGLQIYFFFLFAVIMGPARDYDISADQELLVKTCLDNMNASDDAILNTVHRAIVADRDTYVSYFLWLVCCIFSTWVLKSSCMWTVLLEFQYLQCPLICSSYLTWWSRFILCFLTSVTKNILIFVFIRDCYKVREVSRYFEFCNIFCWQSPLKHNHATHWLMLELETLFVFNWNSLWSF
jgi:hypothetical protein